MCEDLLHGVFIQEVASDVDHKRLLHGPSYVHRQDGGRSLCLFVQVEFTKGRRDNVKVFLRHTVYAGPERETEHVDIDVIRSTRNGRDLQDLLPEKALTSEDDGSTEAYEQSTQSPSSTGCPTREDTRIDSSWMQ